MNKKVFIAGLAARTGRTVTETQKFVDNFLALTSETLASGEDVMFLGFGRFFPRKQTARPVRNPKTGAPSMLDERTTVRFKPGKFLLNTVNKK